MKKLLSLTLLLATLLTFSACEDKNEPELTNNAFVGIWDHTEIQTDAWGYTSERHYIYEINNDYTITYQNVGLVNGELKGMSFSYYTYEIKYDASGKEYIYIHTYNNSEWDEGYLNKEGVLQLKRCILVNGEIGEGYAYEYVKIKSNPWARSVTK
ncbi:MAG: hypothetical protein K2K82_07795 [Muribaculaceae bacterium]|nr:hypothetical protein [Muribaculaceae bacterium]